VLGPHRGTKISLTFPKIWQFILKMAAITFAVTTGNLQSSVQINAESQSKIALPTMLLWELQLV